MVSSFAAGLAEGAVKGMDIRSHRLAEKAKLDAAKQESKTQREWQSAENGNVTMQIFLRKNILGQQDKIEQTELDEPLVWSAD